MWYLTPKYYKFRKAIQNIFITNSRFCMFRKFKQLKTEYLRNYLKMFDHFVTTSELYF